MAEPNYPVVRLRPKANASAIRRGFPWAYDNEVVTDRRTRGLPPGSLAALEDSDRRPLGLVAVNPLSRIFARLLDPDPTAIIDRAWFDARIGRALSLRKAIYDAPHYRLAHAEADGLPGLVIDRYGHTVVIQPNAAWADARLDLLGQSLQAVAGVRGIVVNGAGRARQLEGLDEHVSVVAGDVDGPLAVPMNGATYMADLLGGQKTGLFFDQRPNHAFAARLASPDRDVLDVFSHVGGFSLAALAGGARSAMAVDGSRAALDLAMQGAERTGVGQGFSTRHGDAFDVMAALGQEGRRFGIVICDPPAFAPRKAAVAAGLRAYERVARLAAELVQPDGFVGVNSCSHAVNLEQFRNASVRGFAKAGRRAQLIHTGFAGPDHPILPQLAESGYLKSLFFRLD